MRDTRAFVAYNEKDDEIVVAFRGTNGADYENWITNINGWRVPYKVLANVYVHKGFSDAYNDISEELLTAISNQKSLHKSASIIVTGHSLGGALATLCAIDVREILKFPLEKVTFYSFGSPRVGNDKFADYVMELFEGGNYKRVTHYTDMVVHCPPPMIGFKHSGNEVWYKNENYDSVFIECPNEPLVRES